MKKSNLLSILFFILMLIMTVTLIGCGDKVETLDSLKNEYGIIVDGGEFEEGSVLVSNEIVSSSEEGKNILSLLENENYDKNGILFLYDIYVTKEDKKIQPKGKVKLTIPNPNESINDYLIFHIKNNNEIDKIVPSIENNNLIVEIESFSYFAIVQATHVHNYNSVVTAPTCVDKGFTTYTCNCGDTYVDTYTDALGHTFDDGVITKEPNHYEEGIKTYTCTICKETKEETIGKSDAHLFTEWYPDLESEDKHSRVCNCGKKETADCTFDNGVITQEPTHFYEGIKTYTCTECGRTKEETIGKSDAHLFTEWYPSYEVEDKHVRECKCGEKETADCTFDNGVITQKPSHVEEGIKTYTCTECGRTKEETIGKSNDHLFGDWAPDQTNDNKHTRECKCGEKETADCTFDNGVITQKPSHVEEGIKTYTCTECGRTKEEKIDKTNDHLFGDWVPDQTNDNKHTRECKCGEKEIGDCTFDNGKVTKEPTHFEEGIKTYTCTECGRTKEEKIDKTNEHSFSSWAQDFENDDKHFRVCNCGEKETADCTFDKGKITKEPTHLEEGIRTYTCTECGRTKEETIAKTIGHSFGDWTTDPVNEDKHYKECKCGEKETANCTFDNGKVTKEPTHLEEGIKTYTCTECGRTKEETVAKTTGHSFGDWIIDPVNEDKHYKECKCGEKEISDCTFDNGTTDAESGLTVYTCTICGRKKSGESGIIIVITGGTATFEGTKTVTSNSKLYGENANVYIAQENDVLNVTLKVQNGRTFKYWASATGTIIPDEDFSLLVLRSGYYYPVFEDADINDFSNRKLIFKGNCEEGNLYMSTNSKGDIKYELEFENGGYHDFYGIEQFDGKYHKMVCTVCGEVIYEDHNINDSFVEKEATHSKEGIIKYECSCGHTWSENIPITDEHSIDYNDWHIIEESKNGQYGKYRVYCEYCDYYEEYWYLNNVDFVSFIDGKMINYQYTYGGKVCHNEYYYSYRNAEDEKVYIWAIQYEYEYSSNADYKDTYIFMYIDDEDSSTIEPIYLSKSKGDRRAEYLWAIYGYAYDVNDWIKVLDSPDYNIGCSDGMLLSNSMSARSSVFESYHDYWAETYNKLRIPTTKEYNDLSGTPWELYHEGKSFQGGYYDENDEYVTTGGRDIISYVKDKGTSYQKYMHVDKETGITYGYEDYGTSYRSIFIMRTYKEIISPEEFEQLDDAGKSVVYSYGDIEKDIKSLCAKRNSFNNFTLTIPETITSFRLLFSDPFGFVELSGSNVNVYYNSAYVYNSGSPITFTWADNEDIVFDRYEIWNFENQKWVTLSESSTYTFNSSSDPRRTAAYVRVVCHEVDVPVEPGETFRISVENGYFEIDGKEYYNATEVAGNTLVYVYANSVPYKTFDHWVDGDGNEFTGSSFTVTSNISLKPVYVDTKYTIYYSGWSYESKVSVDGGEEYYTGDFTGKIGDSFVLKSVPLPESECNVFIGWYLETYKFGSLEYILLSDSQTFTYTIEGDVNGSLYGVWTTGENPFIKKYVDIRVVNGFVRYAGGEGDIGGLLDNAYSAISLSKMGRATLYDDPTDETVYTCWDVAFKYDLEGEVVHNTCESFEDEYDYYPAEFWVDDPQYSYPDGVINVTGIIDTNNDEQYGGIVIG